MTSEYDITLTAARERIKSLQRQLEASRMEIDSLRAARDVALEVSAQWAAPRLASRLPRL
jgi:hypothetical protein